MKIAVRYYSRSGHTKTAAEAMARAVGVRAVSVDTDEAPLQEPVDLLLIGGALYAYGLDKHLRTYLKMLSLHTVKRAAVFSTSWLSKHAIDLIRNGLKEVGIPVEDAYFYVKGMPDEAQQQQAAAWARKWVT